MNEHKQGRRQQQTTSGFARWRAERKAKLAGMTRQERIRHRLLQGLTGVSALIILVWAVFTFGFQPPQLPSVGPGDVSVDGAESWDVEHPDLSHSGRKPGIYTFLVVGFDTSSGATDTMLLLSYNTNEKTVQGINLPRDTIMNVSTTSKRLNTVYTINKGKDKETQVEKGMTALKEAIADLTGITADYYVMLEWEAIGELVDAIDGVEFEVPFDMHYDDPYQDLHIHQEAGLRVLSGDDAMQVIRHRKNNDGSHSAGDVGRLSIQQDFLKAVVKKCLQPATFLKLPALVEIFTENVKTDLTVGNILAFAKTAYGMDAENGVSFQTAPLAADAWYKGAAMVTLDGQKILEIVNGGMNPYVRDIQLGDLELIYKKADGSYGVTRGQLADPRMGTVTVVSKPEPVEPETPVEPEVPAEPEQPVETETPVEPEVPVEAEQPVEPETPVETEQPVEAEPPVEQEPPAEPETSVEPQQPAEPEAPEQTGEEIPEWMIPVTP